MKQFDQNHFKLYQWRLKGPYEYLMCWSWSAVLIAQIELSGKGYRRNQIITADAESYHKQNSCDWFKVLSFSAWRDIGIAMVKLN